MHVDAIRAASPRRRRHLDDDGGFTLAEMMVAIFVVGFVLTAMAATLLTSLRATSSNERETRATAFAQQELEILQSVNWDFAGLYVDDIATADARWSDRLDSGGGFDGQELITIPGPSPAGDRVASVARPTSTIAATGTTYTIDRYLTWVDRTGDGTVDTRRFTVVVTWGDREADRGITLTAERAPAQGDTTSTAGGTRVLQMHVAPNPAQLDGDQELTGPVEIRVLLNQASPTSNELQYYTLVDGDTPGEQDWVLRTVDPSPLSAEDLAATAEAPNTRFRFVIPAGDRFVAGSQNLLYLGRDQANQPIEHTRSATFVGGTIEGEGMPSPVPPSLDDEPPAFGFPPPPESEAPEPDDDPIVVPSQPVNITGVTFPSRPNICIDGSTWVPNDEFTIDITGTGLPDPIGTVTVTYTHRVSAGTGQPPETTVTDSAEFVSGTAAAATYRFTLPTANRYFRHNDNPTFTIEARRAGDDSNASTTRTVGVEDKKC